MSELEPGDKAPAFKTELSDGESTSLADYQGSWVILYFYPKNNTPGCTKEACAFRDSAKQISGLDAVILGCSPDSVESHGKFITKFDLPFKLLADPDNSIAQAYGVWKEKNMYGRKYMGIERSTFLIDPQGKIRKIWRRVKVDGHVDAVIEELQALTA